MPEAAVLTRRPENESARGDAGFVLIIDDEAAIRESLQTLLEMEGYNVTTAANGEEGLAKLGDRPFELVLLDLALPDRNGIELLADISRRRTEEENVQLKRALKQRYSFENIVGKSDVMLKIFDLVSQVATSRSTILLQGESGTGKELIAKAIHLHSDRRERPFVPVNTGSMPADLLESTLFGHVKGAFTSAIASKKGLFEVADRGTLFLDEIGNMSMDTQAKILRVLQDRKFMHLGGVQEIQVDVRIIAATNVDLRQLVREGKFREDLFYRLN